MTGRDFCRALHVFPSPNAYPWKFYLTFFFKSMLGGDKQKRQNEIILF